MADWKRSTFTPFKKGDRVWLDLVRFQEPEDNLSQENEAKTGRTLCYYQSTGTGNL